MTYADKPILSYITTDNTVQEYITNHYPVDVNILQMEFYTEYVSKFSTKSLKPRPCRSNFTHADLLIQLVAASFSDDCYIYSHKKSLKTEFLFMIKRDERNIYVYVLHELTTDIITDLFIELIVKHVHYEMELKNLHLAKDNEDVKKPQEFAFKRRAKLKLWEYRKLYNRNQFEYLALMTKDDSLK